MRYAVIWLEDRILPLTATFFLIVLRPLAGDPHTGLIEAPGVVVVLAVGILPSLAWSASHTLVADAKRRLSMRLIYSVYGVLIGYAFGFAGGRSMALSLALVLGALSTSVALHAGLEYIRPPDQRNAGRGRPPAIDLPVGRHEKAIWVGKARNPRSFMALVPLGVMYVYFATSNPDFSWAGIGLFFLVVGLVITLMESAVEVTITDRVVTVSMKPLGLPSRVIPLGRISSASVDDSSPWMLGGAAFRRSTVVIRSGPALRLAIVGEKDMLVSVDDADRGAALINEYVARSADSA
jgi:hypothetical protein